MERVNLVLRAVPLTLTPPLRWLALAAVPPRSRQKHHQNDPIPAPASAVKADEPHPLPAPPPLDRPPLPASKLKPPSLSVKPSQPPQAQAVLKEKQPGVCVCVRVCVCVYVCVHSLLSAVAKSRKSNCVKEVERLRKNRDVRR